MSRFLPLAFLAASLAQAAPAPKGKDPVYYPTKEGDTRIYEFRVGDRVEGGYTDTVTKVEKKDDALHVTVAREPPGKAPAATMAVSKEGVFRVAFDGKALDKPVPLLKMPAKAGTKWEFGAGAICTIVKEEEVEVPAGKFQAICVESVSGTSKTLRWFAPDVGLVKMRIEGSDREQVLKEFKAAK